MPEARIVEESTKLDLVFVYGSLLSGMGNHGLLGDSPLVATTVMTFPGPMVSLGSYPALIRTNDRIEKIKGEVYSVTPDVFKILDRLEGYPLYYSREQRRVQSGEVAWVYFLPPRSVDKMVHVVSGSWREHRSNYARN